jgi:DNA-directed RNA polymerase III subunit RPC3
MSRADADLQRVADVLLTRGRLSLSHIVRFGQLKPRTARACVLALVQHNLLWHAHTPQDGEVLELNTDECLARLRFGRYVALAEHLFGHAVRAVGVYAKAWG